MSHLKHNILLLKIVSLMYIAHSHIIPSYHYISSYTLFHPRLTSLIDVLGAKFGFFGFGGIFRDGANLHRSTYFGSASSTSKKRGIPIIFLTFLGADEAWFIEGEILRTFFSLTGKSYVKTDFSKRN